MSGDAIHFDLSRVSFGDGVFDTLYRYVRAVANSADATHYGAPGGGIYAIAVGTYAASGHANGGMGITIGYPTGMAI